MCGCIHVCCRLLLGNKINISLSRYAVTYFFFFFFFQVKRGPFAEHSNTLWGISGVPEWSKVNSGLIKMFKAEVFYSITLCTFPS